GALSGMRFGTDRRAGSAHGWHSHIGTRFRSHRTNFAQRFRFLRGAPRCARRDIAEAEHGAFRQRKSKAGFGGGSRRSYRSLLEGSGPRRCARDRVSLGWPNRSASDRTSKRDESYRGLAVAAELFLWARLASSGAQSLEGETANISAAQTAFHHRAWCNSKARFGKYTEEMETAKAA